MHPHQRIYKVKSSGERLSAYVAEKIDNSDMSGGNNAKARKQHYKKHDDYDDEQNSTRFHRSECKQFGAAMSKAFIVMR